MQVLKVKPNKNSDIINDYITTMQIEINLSKGYETLTTWVLIKLSQFHEGKSFSKMKREDIVAFLNSFRKPDTQDPCTNGLEPIT